jgi:hypothetical protein
VEKLTIKIEMTKRVDRVRGLTFGQNCFDNRRPVVGFALLIRRLESIRLNDLFHYLGCSKKLVGVVKSTAEQKS